jgi:adenosylcobalamin-dependent ribonucleoside-triphosphate reductase
MGTDFVEERTGAGLFNCLAAETQILTKEYGWISIGDLLGDIVTVMAPDGNWVQAPIRAFGVQKLQAITLSRNRNETKTIYATANHRWFVRDNFDSDIQEVHTENLKLGQYLQMAYGQGIANVIPSPQGIQHGIVFGDGSLEKETSACRVALCGEKNKELLKWFPHNPISIQPDLCKDGAILVRNLPRFFKDEPGYSESKAYLLGWLMGYFAADGSVSANVSPTICSTDRRNIRLVEDIAALLGIATGKPYQEKRISNLTNEESILWKITLSSCSLIDNFFLLEEHRKHFVSQPKKRSHTRQWRVVSVQDTNRVEEVYCATVPNYGAFVIEGNIVTGNCAFRSTKDLATKGGYIFQWIMDALMLGVGVGFDTLGAGTLTVKQPGTVPLPSNYFEVVGISYKDVSTFLDTWSYLVEDSREGWVKTLRLCLDSFYFGYPMPHFDFSQIRKAGEPIKGFGGISSGPEPLIKLIESIQELYTFRLNQPVSSVDIVDTENLIGRCVVSGNVRRSAALALGARDDFEYLTMKNDQEKLMSHRWGSNNSYVAEVGMDYTWHANQVVTNGEPGTIWLNNARHYGRMKDPERLDDLQVMGFNPCSEQQLEDAELCCLTETFPAKHETYDDYLQTLKIAYLYAKTVTLARTHWKETNAVMQKNRRIGLSQSGVVQAMNKFGTREILNWCDKGYSYIKRLDEKYSDWLCIPRSKRTTSIKPSGTVSLLNGSTPGIHFPEDEYYIRRIRFAESSELLPSLMNAGYPIESCKYSPNTIVVSFPCKEPYFSRGKREVSMWEQLELAAAYQHYWADNSVSVTITFKENEAKDIKHALELYETKLKTVSFLRYEETGYVQAPYEPITEAQYQELIKNITPVQKFETQLAGAGTSFCDSDSCEIDWSKFQVS